MLLTISVTVIAAILLITVIALIPVLLQIRRTALEAQRLLETVRLQIAPASHDLTVISQKVRGIVESVHQQVERVEASLTTVHDGVIRLRDFEEDLLNRIEAPLIEVAALISAVSRGIEAAMGSFRRS